MPAQLTTSSHSTSPASVRTPTTSSTRPRGRVITCSTETPSTTRTPRSRAPRARLIVTSTGLTRPSPGHVEAGEQVVGAGQREELGHLARPDLVDLEAELPLEGGDPAVLVEPVGIGRGLDQADPLEPGRHPGLGLEAGVEVAGVEPQPGVGLAGGAEAGHQAGRVPRGARGEPVALEHEHVGDPEVGQVVGDRGADDAAPDDDDPGPLRQRRRRGRGGGRRRRRTGGSTGAAVLTRRPDAAHPARTRTWQVAYPVSPRWL